MRTPVLHNMSVPPTSRISVARADFPGLRFTVRLAEKEAGDLREQLATGGWRAAWTILESRNDAPARKGARRQRDLERHLIESLEKAGVPDRLGVFVDEAETASPDTRPLPPAAALAVLARRSGRLYLPTRRLEPSLADPRGARVLFFPEEESR